jgi:hypothetical protein
MAGGRVETHASTGGGVRCRCAGGGGSEEGMAEEKEAGGGGGVVPVAPSGSCAMGA